MRLWAKQLIPVLPKQMLVSQWRELSAIVGAINKNGTPNHRLVNKVMEYARKDLFFYSKLVVDELEFRGYKWSESVWFKIAKYTGYHGIENYFDRIYCEWHNERYLKQCLYNLQEKYDCDIITEQEWQLIKNKFGYLLEG